MTAPSGGFWRIGVLVPTHPQRVLRLEERRLGYPRAHLPQRLDVVENPESSAMCGHDDVVLVHDQIADR